MLRTDTRNAMDQLKNFSEDIKYSLEQEDGSINVSQKDLLRINMIIETIKSLETDYERLYDKIAYAVHLRANEVGRTNIEGDLAAQILIAIKQSET